MIFGSVCSGIEAASVAWKPLGWKSAFFSEIEKFPSAVLDHHCPRVPNLGDMTKFKEWPDAIIDVLVGGTPCQSFSIAGLRKGLDDPRGNLMLTYLAIADRYRPKWLVWENVPGVLSSNGGRDFGTFLGGLAKLGYGFAYRVLDAQYAGVPQRRRRVFVVGHLGNWRRAAAVLFERHSLSGNTPPSRQARQTAPTILSRSTAGGGLGTDFDCDGGLIASTGDTAHCLNAGGMGSQDYETETLITHSLRAEGFDASEDGTGRGTPLVPAPAIAFDCKASGQNGFGVGEVASTMRSMGHANSHQNGGGHQAVMYETLYNKGFIQLTNEARYASIQKTNTGTLLLRVREEIGAEAFAKWGLGILDSLQSPEILRSVLYGKEFRQAAFSRSWVVCCALGSPFSCSEGAVQSLRESGGERCSSQGWKPSEQFASELGAYLSELSRPGAQAQRFVRDLWGASEGIGLLRETLSAIQETWRRASGEGQPVHGIAQRDRKQSAEGVQSRRMRAETPRKRILREACATSEERDSWERPENQERGGLGSMAVRRLTPVECEFLQGFPRNYTLIPGRAADGPRYKALGNSMAVPVMRWIGERISMVSQIAQ